MLKVERLRFPAGVLRTVKVSLKNRPSGVRVAEQVSDW